MDDNITYELREALDNDFPFGYIVIGSSTDGFKMQMSGNNRIWIELLTSAARYCQSLAVAVWYAYRRVFGNKTRPYRHF